MSFGSRDLRNADRYALQRETLLRGKLLRKRLPHIGSWIRFSVRPADPVSDYFYERDSVFAKRAIVVERPVVGAELCASLSCDSLRDDGRTCVRSDAPRVEWIGDDLSHYSVKCGPACFNLKTKRKDDDSTDGANTGGKKDEDVHFYNVNWRRGKCRFVTSGDAWMRTPWTRSDARFELRTNDLAVGFTLDETRDNILDARADHYRMNAYYCGQWQDEYDSNRQNCITPLTDRLLGPVVGETLLKTVRYLVDKGTTRPTSDAIQSDPRPSPPATIAPKYATDLTAWLKHIDDSNPPPDEECNVPTTDAASAVVSVAAASKDDPEKSTHWTEVAKHILEQLFSFESISQIVLGELASTVIAKIANALKTMSARLLKQVASLAASGALRAVGTQVFRGAFATTVRQFVRQYVAGTLLKTAAYLARTLAAAASVVGILLDIGALVDLVLSFWDPFKLNEGIKYPDNYLDELQRQLHNSFLVQSGLSENELTFNHIHAELLTSDEQIQVAASGLLWRIEYLNHLTVNDEGNVIDKEETIGDSDDPPYTNALTPLHLYQPADVYADSTLLGRRLMTANILSRVGFAVMISGGLLFVLLRSSVLLLLAVIVSLGLFVCSQFLTVGPRSSLAYRVGQWSYEELAKIGGVFDRVLDE